MWAVSFLIFSPVGLLPAFNGRTGNVGFNTVPVPWNMYPADRRIVFVFTNIPGGR
jgi:hypothetical protein